MHGRGEVNGSGSWIYLRKEMLKRIQTGVEPGLWVINVNHSSLVVPGWVGEAWNVQVTLLSGISFPCQHRTIS